MGCVSDCWSGFCPPRWKKASSRAGLRRCRRGSCLPPWRPPSSCSQSSSRSSPRNRASARRCKLGITGVTLQSGVSFILLQNVLCQDVFDLNVLVSCGCCLLLSSCRRFYFYRSYHPPLLSSFKVQFAKIQKKKEMRIAFVAISNTVCVLTESNLSVIVNHGVIIGC